MAHGSRGSLKHFERVCVVKAIFIIVLMCNWVWHHLDIWTDGAKTMVSKAAGCLGKNKGSGTHLYQMSLDSSVTHLQKANATVLLKNGLVED